eukprot:Blabericola_migrator_1__407@NODE_10_length_25093_cov_104_131184_g7_i2_p9_GENE_NODE_10_length_25093_cov_104_131184_g7_i2NODE_10_length_25093_cov_104_131184_g7_i2_p9_ORF_typecomplete_len391_score102_54BSD/PF03909_17/4_1e10Plant_NMP1/PF06694_11/0_047Plant_NMP1/PF06694_11/3_7e03DXP_synthase_N/PF13292_6/0_1Nexin_C/PF08628_12/4_8Nexin_C/PF08628_12/2_1e02Orthopox_A5L/PF06193_11/4_9Orthopox_A5L/PF06193_11/1_1e02_NODE_10_length_25093_cov_104_131184_g7_i235654737
MESLFKSVLSTFGVNQQGDQSQDPIPPSINGDVIYTSVPNEPNDLSLSNTLSSLTQNLSSLTSSENFQFIQQKIEQLRSDPQVATWTHKIQDVTTTLKEAAKEFGDEVHRELDTRKFFVMNSGSAFDPEAEEFRTHPLRYLPWEAVENLFPNLIGPDLYTEDQITRAIQFMVQGISQQLEGSTGEGCVGLPDFHMDKPYQRCAVEVLKMDKRLETLRYKLVPRHMSETEFWAMYFKRFDELVATFPQSFIPKLQSIKDEDERLETQARNREMRVKELMEEEATKLGTAPVSMIPDIFTTDVGSKISDFLHTTLGITPVPDFPSTAEPVAQADDVRKLLQQTAKPAVTHPVAQHPTQSVEDSPLYAARVPEGQEWGVDDAELDEFEKQLLG